MIKKARVAEVTPASKQDRPFDYFYDKIWKKWYEVKAVPHAMELDAGNFEKTGKGRRRAMVNIEIRTGGESEKIRIETVRKNGVTLLQIRKLHLLGSEWRETGEVITMTPGEARAIGKDLMDCGIAEMRKAPKPSWE